MLFVNDYIKYMITYYNLSEYLYYYNNIEFYDKLYHKKELSEYTYVNLQGNETKVTRKKCNISNVVINKICNTMFAEKPDIICDKRTKNAFDNFIDTYIKNYNLFLAHGIGVIKPYVLKGEILFQYIPANEIIPYTFENDNVTGIKIYSILKQTDEYAYILEEDIYKLDNKYITKYEVYNFNIKNNNIKDVKTVNKDMIKNIINIENNIEESYYPNYIILTNNFNLHKYYETSTNLGSSLLYDKEDQIENVEVAYDSLTREIILGKKRIIVPSEFLEFVQDEDGNLKKYFDPAEEIYESFHSEGQKMDEIKDISTDLRIKDTKDALTTLMNLLSISFGLSSNFLKLEDIAVEKSATEVISQNNDTYKFMKIQQSAMANDIRKAKEIIYGIIKRNNISIKDMFEVIFYDNILEDRNTLMRYYNERINNKTMSRIKAIMKLDKVSEKEAVNTLNQIIYEENVFNTELKKITNDNEVELITKERNILDNVKEG